LGSLTEEKIRFFAEFDAFYNIWFEYNKKLNEKSTSEAMDEVLNEILLEYEPTDAGQFHNDIYIRLWKLTGADKEACRNKVRYKLGLK